MESLFLDVLNMSITGTCIIIFLGFIRIQLIKGSKIILYYLWGVAGFRLLFSISFKSMFSLLPFGEKPVQQYINFEPPTDIIVYNASTAVSAPLKSMNNNISIITICSYIWFIGFAIMLIYGLVSYFKLKDIVKNSEIFEDNIYISKNINTPFVFGVIKPKIYLPVGLKESELKYIILHEQTHIKRFDHIVKFIAYYILCLHWFNPIVWAGFRLMTCDMEMSCDEYILKHMGSDIKKDYSLSLLSLSTEKHAVRISPIAFGESDVKDRIKNILNFKKTSVKFLVFSLCLAVFVTVGFLSNRAFAQYETKEIFSIDGNYAKNGKFTIPEFPNITFVYSQNQIGYIKDNLEKVIFEGGLAIESLYLSDLNSDGFPELCSCTDYGSGMWIFKVLAYDYKNKIMYNLKDTRDYVLIQENNDLYIQKYNSNTKGKLAIKNGELIGIGVDHRPKLTDPSPTTGPSSISNYEQPKETYVTPSPGTPPANTPPTIPYEFDLILSNAIIKNSGLKGEGIVSHYTLMSVDDNNNVTTIKALALAVNYTFDGVNLKQGDYVCTPIIVTIENNKIKEYWKPETGDNYISSLRTKFTTENLENFAPEMMTDILMPNTIRKAQNHFGIKDHETPTINILKPLVILKGEKPNWKDYFSIVDNVDGVIDWSNAKIEDKIDYNIPGKYYLDIIISDNVGNKEHMGFPVEVK